MNRRFKLKINGESPRSLFLALILANLNCDVYLNNFFRNLNPKKDYQILLFSNFARNLLHKLDIWNDIEDISYSFNSLSIKDNLISEQLLLRAENFSEKYLNAIGWTAKYSDIKSLLINKLANYDNVHFISKNQIIDESLNFDYEFNFKNYDEILNLHKFPYSTFKRIDEQILIFNVYLRGHVEKRMYEINTKKGLLVLTPLNKNLYQIIWNNPSFKIKETSLNSKSLFLDNLTTLLPNQIKVDQIFGDVNVLNVCNINTTFLVKNKSIYFNENKFKSNTIYDFNFDIIVRNIINLFNFIENKKSSNIKILNKFGFYYLLSKYVEITMNFFLINLLFNLFKINNIISLSIRKLMLIVLKRINFIKILFMSNLNNSNINNLIN